MAVKNYAQEMKGYIRRKYDVPDECEIVVKQGYVTGDSAPVETQKSFAGLIAALLLATGLAFTLSRCSDPDEQAQLEAEYERALLVAEKLRRALLAMGLTHYEIVASGNENMCDRCAEMAGQAFPLEELAIGVNAPPFHPNCGCRVVAIEDIFDGMRKPPVPPAGILGDRTENRIAELHPDIQENARMALYEMQQKLGDVRVVEAYRSFEKQNEDYARRATRVRGGYIYHQYGLAFDIGFFRDDGSYWEDPNGTDKELQALYARAGEIGKKYGFEWGGDWGWDAPHFQMPYGYECSELLKMPTVEDSDYLRQIDLSRKYQSQPSTSSDSEPPAWER